ncbi:MAG: dTDP-glucose 4,6-dehydratase [Proteobacteria bacterium]|nr:dTDP-glucose 4,6-dehydratase [Pseudomonadota bacterium]
MKYMVTGGHGFIGSNLCRLLLEQNKDIVVVDSLTYASNQAYLKNWAKENNKKFEEEILDIRDHVSVARMMQKHKPDVIFHLAAESHVCRSISGPKDFVTTNVLGTFHLIEEFRQLWGDNASKKFVHVSTDEVYGELELNEPPFCEYTPIKPRSPYSATKAGSDHIVQSYFHTYGVSTIITNCSNNFGPNQHKEKLIPATIQRLHRNKPVRLYGNGQNIRDWLWVEDHARGLMLLAEKGTPGQKYCIGGECEKTNLQIINAVFDAMATRFGKLELTIEFTNDRPTDDKRYAINCDRLKALGWAPSSNLKENLLKTVDYYLVEFKRG